MRPPLHLIPGTPAPDTELERSRKRLRQTERPAEMLQCPRCAGREIVEARTGALMRRGRLVGGSVTLICVACLTRGERIVVS